MMTSEKLWFSPFPLFREITLSKNLAVYWEISLCLKLRRIKDEVRQARRGATRAVLVLLLQEGWKFQEQICGYESACRSVRREVLYAAGIGVFQSRYKRLLATQELADIRAKLPER